jgi:anaphase-promoting complex subunit 6
MIVPMEKYLRDWRQEALNRHQYDTAIFVADKLLALTSMSIGLATLV